MGQILPHLPGQVIEPVEGGGMEESVSRFPKHSGHLVVVVGHQLGLWRLLGEGEQTVDILNSLEGFLEKGRAEDLKKVYKHLQTLYNKWASILISQYYS